MYNFSQFAEVAVEEIAENVEVAAIISLGQEDAEIPHPFPFPTHYRSDIGHVHICLQGWSLPIIHLSVPSSS